MYNLWLLPPLKSMTLRLDKNEYIIIIVIIIVIVILCTCVYDLYRK